MGLGTCFNFRHNLFIILISVERMGLRPKSAGAACLTRAKKLLL